MDLAKRELSKAFEYEFPLNSRKIVHKLKWFVFNGMWKWNYSLPMEYNPFTPGLEVKYAIEEAKKLNSNIVYMDYELDPLTKNKLYHETRFSIFKTIFNMLKTKSTYAREYFDYENSINQYGIKKFVESSVDQYFINW